MKTLTVTLHDSYNCGSSLQAYALQHFLLSNGIENEILDYAPLYMKEDKKSIKRTIKGILYGKYIRKRAENFTNFKNRYLKLTDESYTDYDQLLREDIKSDCIILGSDQLWNSMYPCGRDPAYYASFSDSNKIAYAVSMGRENIPEENLKIVKNYAEDFKWISVREKSSVQQLKTCVPCDVEYVCDPVLLNDVESYEGIKADRLIAEPYIFVYMAQEVDEQLLSYTLNELLQKTKAKVVYSGTYRKRCNCDIHLREASPSEFLSLIANAECVISNSFHATMFSLMYRKQFVTVLPPENGERISSILALCGLQKQSVGSIEDKISFIDPECYQYSEMVLREFRNSSRQKILDVLSGLDA